MLNDALGHEWDFELFVYYIDVTDEEQILALKFMRIQFKIEIERTRDTKNRRICRKDDVKIMSMLEFE